MSTEECNIIQDILPLYVDEIVSEDTISFVEKHLETCVVCREKLEKMKETNDLEIAILNKQDNREEDFKVFAQKWKKKRQMLIIAISTILLIMALLGSCFVSYVVFRTVNPFSAAIGFIQITLTDTDYVEIQHSPKVILAQPNNTILTEYMESRGFIEMKEEQMGACHVFTNGEEKEWIMYSVNGYYSKWIWEYEN